MEMERFIKMQLHLNMNHHILKRTGFLLALLLWFTNSFAQNNKPGVLVIGSSPASIAAAIQAAHSGVQTILLDQGDYSQVTFLSDEAQFLSGVYGDFVKRVEAAQRFPVKTGQVFSPGFTGTILKAWMDTIKNLNILTRMTITRVDRSGNRWHVTLGDNSVLKTDAIVDGSSAKYVLELAGAKCVVDSDAKDNKAYKDLSYRSSVALTVGSKMLPACVPMKTLFTDKVNIFVTGNEAIGYSTANGQAAGAMAAYCSFFKKTNKEINVRSTQFELINYRAVLMQFADVPRADKDFRAIEGLGLTGILKGHSANGKLWFQPDSLVSFEEIRMPFKQYFSRSQIWFLDNNGKELRLKDLISLIKFVANRGKELDVEITKGWKTGFRFEGEFNPERPITRRAFAVLLSHYVKPFLVGIDLNGNLKR